MQLALPGMVSLIVLEVRGRPVSIRQYMDPDDKATIAFVLWRSYATLPKTSYCARLPRFFYAVAFNTVCFEKL